MHEKNSSSQVAWRHIKKWETSFAAEIYSNHIVSTGTMDAMVFVFLVVFSLGEKSII
jgi:hypothetical protein